MNATKEQFDKAGFSYPGFMAFVNAKPADDLIMHKEGKDSSWNNCAVGLYLKSIGINDDFNHENNMHNVRLLSRMMFENEFPWKIVRDLIRSCYDTYGELALAFNEYTEPMKEFDVLTD